MKSLIKEQYQRRKAEDADKLYIFKANQSYLALNQDAKRLFEWFALFVIRLDEEICQCLFSEEMFLTIQKQLEEKGVPYAVIEMNSMFPVVTETEASAPDIPTKKTSIKSFLRHSLVQYLLVLLVVFVVGLSLKLLLPYQNYTILTQSMEPVLMRNDLILINRRVDKQTLQPGDIIAFRVDTDNSGTIEVVVHYVHSISTTTTPRTIYTNSEVSQTQDPWTLTDEDILGTYVWRIPRVGRVFLFFSSTFGKLVLVFDLIIIYLVLYFFEEKKKMMCK